ncbi:MAG TPA: peptidoglycan DD-metalloendopeptidase family protein [Geobacteraceae bacterium]|nr:peptidoglycan DD-metalloendopeptidase family protein [Geobacteraceae bacterium]
MLLYISFMSFLSGSVWGADVKQQLQGIKKEIKEKKQLINKTTRVENVVTGEIAKIDQNLKDKNASLNVLKNDLQKVENNLKRTGLEVGTLKVDVERRKHQIRKRLVSEYKAGYASDIRFFFSSESFPQLVEGTRYMKSVLENDRKMLAEHNSRIERLKQLQVNLEREAQKKEGIKSSIELKKGEIEAEKKNKAVYLAKVKEDKKNYQSSLQQLEANSRRLQTIIRRLEALSRKRAAEEKKRAAEEKNVSRNVVRKRVDSPPPSSSSPDTGFMSQKGRLFMPARGQIISGFGRHKHPQFNSYTFNNGISIAAPAGTDVRAIYDGKVIYAEYFKGYGNLVVVDHGGGYFSLYAHNSRVQKRVGATVAKNDTVASVGDIDSTNGPMLYFEIRYQGKPVDPSHWVR